MRNVIILLFSILLLTSQVFGFTISNPASSGSGSGDVSVSGTPAANDIAQWVNATDIKGMTYAELAAIAGFESALEAVLDVADLQGFAAVLTAAEIGAAYDTEAELDALFAAKEDQLNNEAGLYDVLSDVTNFLQTGDAIDDDDVAFDDANSDWTATDLGSALEEMVSEINSGTPNSATAKVHWSQLTGVPAGFADNSDDGAAGAPTDVTPVDTADENATFYIPMFDGPTTQQAVETDAGLSYNPYTNVLTVGGGIAVPQNSTAAQYNEYYEDSDDGGNKVTVTAQAMASDRTQTYPDASGTFALTHAYTECIYIEDPDADDDLQSWFANKTANDWTLTAIWGESDQTVNFDFQVDDGTPADVNGTDISPAAGEAEDTSLSGDTTLAAGEELDLAITSVSGTPTWFSGCITYTVNP